MVSVKPVKLGNNVRMSFSKINEVLDMPNLIEIQKDSYEWFLKEGLREVFADFSSVSDFSHNLVLSFIDYRLDDKPKYSGFSPRQRDLHIQSETFHRAHRTAPVFCVLPAFHAMAD